MIIADEQLECTALKSQCTLQISTGDAQIFLDYFGIKT
jgi:hypothetical protein